MLDRRLLIAAFAAALLAPPARAEEKKKGGGLSFIAFPTLTATVMRPDGRRGVLTVEAGIDVPDSGLRARAQSVQPRLQAAYVQVLQIYAGGLPPATMPDAEYIGQSLQRETDRLLGARGAKLLLGAILVN